MCTKWLISRFWLSMSKDKRQTERTTWPLFYSAAVCSRVWCAAVGAYLWRSTCKSSWDWRGHVSVYSLWQGEGRPLPHQFFHWGKMTTYAHTLLTAFFSGEPELSSYSLDSPSPVIPGLCILLGQTQTLHILLVPVLQSIVPPSLDGMTHLSSFINLHCHTAFYQISIILTSC